MSFDAIAFIVPALDRLESGREVPVISQAVKVDNLDQAALLVQDAFGITDGGVAAVSLPTDECWAGLDAEQRERAIVCWLTAECRFAD